ncbi:MAG: hypothetical protein ACSHX7_14680 [Luteolibacter sp.]
MKISIIWIALSASVLANPVATQPITAQELAAKQRNAGLGALTRTIEIETKAVPRPADESILAQSEILNDGVNWTIVPKGAVLFTPEKLTAPDLLKARGEEHFVMHALSDGSISQTQIATAFIQVWPMSDGLISGIAEGEIVRGTPPVLTVTLNDLYPDSHTYIRIYSNGSEIGQEGKIIPSSELALDQEFPESRLLTVDDYGSLFDSDGEYRLELITTSPFDTIILDTGSFFVERSLLVNAMQVDGELSQN